MNKLFFFCLVFIGGLLPSYFVLAQQRFSFRHLTGDDGLSQATITCIHQDKDGFIWIGTGDGLNRYDGNKFTYYKHNPRNENSLPAPMVLCIYEDNNGYLWIGTDGGGFVIFDKKKEKFEVFKHDKTDKNSLSNNKVWSICHIEGNEYAIGTFGGGLNIFNRTSGRFRIHKHLEGDSSNLADRSISKILVSESGMLWYGSRNGLKGIHTRTGEMVVYKNNPDVPLSIPDNIIQDIYEDKEHRLWVGTFNGGICEFDESKGLFYRQKIESPAGVPVKTIITGFFEDINGKLWIGTYGSGIIILDKKSKEYQFINNDQGNRHSLSNNIIMCLSGDKSGLLWIGTNGSGLELYQHRYSYFNSMEEVVRKHFSNKGIFSIFKDDQNTLWVGTNGAGLYSLNHEMDEIKNYSTLQPFKNFLGNDEVWTINNDNEHNLWVGTMGGGLYNLNIPEMTSQPYKRDTSDKNSLSVNIVWTSYRDQEGILWFGTQRGGINVFDKNEKKFTHIKKDESNSNSLNAFTVYAIDQDKEGLYYIGTQGGGLNIFDKKAGRFEHFTNEKGNPFSISNNDVYCIYTGVKDLVWLGTNGGGLNVFNKLNKKFRCFTEEDDLPNNVIYGILPDDKGNLWLSTNNGICAFTPPSNLDFDKPLGALETPKPLVRRFNASDGLPSNEFNQGAYFKSKDGMLYFGSINGITAFHPDSIRENQFNPPVVLTGFRVFEKPYPLDSNITWKKQITLRYSQNFFSFEFAALNYLFPEKNTYSYMMENFDPAWNFIGNRHYASYTNLDPGHYVFKVKATNNDGIWSDQIASINIIITPPFWKTGWFKGAMILLVAGLSLTGFRLRIRQIRKEEQKKAAFERELAEVEMKALRAQMNPHFIFNSLNSINKYIWANDQASASDYLARFSRLIRLIFENSMHQSVPLSSDLEALDLYIQMERLRFENKLEYSITVDEDVDAEQVMVPPLIFQPFVENAILHGIMPKGDQGMLTIRFSITGGNLAVVIEDNGIGREKAAERNRNRPGNHKSLGMKVTKDRLDLLNQKGDAKSSVVYTDLMNENGNASGTRVEICMPLEFI